MGICENQTKHEGQQFDFLYLISIHIVDDEKNELNNLWFFQYTSTLYHLIFQFFEQRLHLNYAGQKNISDISNS